MSKTDEKKAFHSEGFAVEKVLNEKRTIVHCINQVIMFFEMKRGQLKESKTKSVADEFKDQMRAGDFDKDQMALCWRLLAQSVYGVDRDFVHDDTFPPTILLLGSFESKNKLRFMPRFYEIMAEHGEDGDLGKRVMHMFSAVELTPDIKEDVEQIVSALKAFEKREIDLDQTVQRENGDVIDEDDDEDGGHRRKKRKAASSASKRIAKKIAETKQKEKELKKKIKEGKVDEDGDGDEADVNDQFDEKEDARLAEAAENAQTAEAKKYKQVLGLFMGCIRDMMEKIAFDKLFTFNVSQFMIDARNVAKAGAKASRSSTSKGKSQKSPTKGSDAMDEDGDGDADEDEQDGGDEDSVPVQPASATAATEVKAELAKPVETEEKKPEEPVVAAAVVVVEAAVEAEKPVDATQQQ